MALVGMLCLSLQLLDSRSDSNANSTIQMVYGKMCVWKPYCVSMDPVICTHFSKNVWISFYFDTLCLLLLGSLLTLFLFDRHHHQPLNSFCAMIFMIISSFFYTPIPILSLSIAFTHSLRYIFRWPGEIKKSERARNVAFSISMKMQLCHLGNTIC